MKTIITFSFGILLVISFLLTQEAVGKQPAQQHECIRKKLTGKNGCYDSKGGCKAGFKYCTSPLFCERNGGSWNGSSCTSGGSVVQNNAEAQCKAKNGIYDGEHLGCYCQMSGQPKPETQPGGRCPEAKSAAATSETGSTEPCLQSCLGNLDRVEGTDCRSLCSLEAPPAVINNASTPLEECITKWKTEATSCKANAVNAERQCNRVKSENEDMRLARTMAGTISSGEVQKLQGSGSVAECGRISLLGTTAVSAMNAFKSTCETEYNECLTSCEKVKDAIENNSMVQECLGKLQMTTPSGKLEDNARWTEEFNKIKTLANSGDAICSGDAKHQKGLIDEVMNAYGNAANSAKKCQCLLAANDGQAQGSPFESQVCDSTPNPVDCLPGGKLAGTLACNIYAGEDCTLGSGKFNSTPCQCARNNSLPICRTSAGSPPPSNFALDLKPNPNGVDIGAGGGGGSGDGDSGMNLGGGYGIQRPNAEFKSENQASTDGRGPGRGTGGGGGGGGLSGGGGGAEDPGAGEDDGSNKGGLAGLFNQMKSSVSSMMGNGKNGKGDGSGLRGGNAGQGLKYDIDKWRPRGLASTGCSGSQVRCKNEDIFTIMNKRYDTKEMSFIQAP